MHLRNNANNDCLKTQLYWLKLQQDDAQVVRTNAKNLCLSADVTTGISNSLRHRCQQRSPCECCSFSSTA